MLSLQSLVSKYALWQALLCAAFSVGVVQAQVHAQPRGVHMVAPEKPSSTQLHAHACWVRYRPQASALYVQLYNVDPSQSAYVVGARSPAFATAELHESFEQDGMLGMRQVAELQVPPLGHANLAPGAHHIMLFDPKEVKVGQVHPFDLLLSNGESIRASCLMKPLYARRFED